MVRDRFYEDNVQRVTEEKKTIAQLLTENNVENFIYVLSTEKNKQNQTLCKQKNSSRWVAASPFNKLNDWEQCFKFLKFPLYLC